MNIFKYIGVVVVSIIAGGLFTLFYLSNDNKMLNQYDNIKAADELYRITSNSLFSVKEESSGKNVLGVLIDFGSEDQIYVVSKKKDFLNISDQKDKGFYMASINGLLADWYQERVYIKGEDVKVFKEFELVAFKLPELKFEYKPLKIAKSVSEVGDYNLTFDAETMSFVPVQVTSLREYDNEGIKLREVIRAHSNNKNTIYAGGTPLLNKELEISGISLRDVSIVTGEETMVFATSAYLKEFGMKLKYPNSFVIPGEDININ